MVLKYKDGSTAGVNIRGMKQEDFGSIECERSVEQCFLWKAVRIIAFPGSIVAVIGTVRQ